MKNTITVGIVQSGPEYLDLEKSLAKAVAMADEAAAKGARLLVFGETWFTGYPAWLDHCPDAAIWNHPATKQVFSRMVGQSLSLSSPAWKILSETARRKEMVIVTGFNETIPEKGGGTLYNSLAIIDPEGRTSVVHRKLMPTYTEKMIYGLGDGGGLHAAATPLGRIGGLICWEHWMPLARQALHDSGELIHVALWPSVGEMHQLASRHYAFEGRCFVIAAGQIMRASDIPSGLDLPQSLGGEPNKLILGGGSCIYGPDGRCLMEPQWNRDELILFTIENLEQAIEERMTLDTSGHYSRPDVFSFQVNDKG